MDVMAEQSSVLPGTIFWIAPFYNRSGYGVGSRAAVCALHRAGVRIRVYPGTEVEAGIDDCDLALIKSLESTPLVPPVTMIVNHVPNSTWLNIELPEPNLRIMATTFDSSVQGNLPPPEWMTVLKEMDQVWLMAEQERDAFIAAGLAPEKVQIVWWPHPWLENPCIPAPAPEPSVEGKPFRFLSIAMFQPRRRWDTLIEAYLEEFKGNGNVELYLKVNYPSWHPMPGKPRQDLLDLVDSLRRKTGSEETILIDEELGARSGILHLMDGCHAYVSTDTVSTAPMSEARVRQRMLICPEGLGLGLTDAMYSPIAVDPDARFPLTQEMLQYQPHHKGAFMPQLHVKDVRRALRSAYEMSPEERRAKAANASDIPGPSHCIPMFLGAVGSGWQYKEQLERQKARNSARRIAWEGSQLVSHSLALINRELCLQLIDSGYEVSIVPGQETDNIPADADPRFGEVVRRTRKALSGKADLTVRHHWPPNFTPPPHGHWVMIQPWEYGRLPAQWVQPMSNLLDELWVPSRHVLKTYVSSGVPADRVQVIPNGVNIDQFYPRSRDAANEQSGKFRFLFVGGSLWRKGVDVLLVAYRNAFRRRDNVVLIVKDFPQMMLYPDQGAAKIISDMQRDPDAPEIVHYRELLDLDKIPGLYNACDCLVHPYRGEGFGLPVVEAMACGLPVITTEGGSTDDFCPPDFTYLIPSRRIEFRPNDQKLAGGVGWLLEPDLDALIALLRDVYENRIAARERALAFSEHIRSTYDWRKIAEKVSARIEVILSRPIRRNV